MRAPVALGWASAKPANPFVVVHDADGVVIAQALGVTPEVAMENAMALIKAVNHVCQETA